jgi:hypothetical protein
LPSHAAAAAAAQTLYPTMTWAAGGIVGSSSPSRRIHPAFSRRIRGHDGLIDITGG